MRENGIIATNGEIDLWFFEGQVYRAKSSDADVLNEYGLPVAKRWECSYQQYLNFKNTVFSWLDEVKEKK